MAYGHSDTAREEELALIEGEWVADVLRIWNADARSWDNRAPITIRLDSRDFVVYAREDGCLGWEAGRTSHESQHAAHAPRSALRDGKKEACGSVSHDADPYDSTPLTVYEIEGGEPSVTYDLIRFPALSEAVGARVERASAKCTPVGHAAAHRESADHTPANPRSADHATIADAPGSNSLELTLDTDEVIKLTVRDNGEILARLTPAFEAPQENEVPCANLQFSEARVKADR